MLNSPESIKAELGYRREKAHESRSKATRPDRISRMVVGRKRRRPNLKTRQAWSL